MKTAKIEMTTSKSETRILKVEDSQITLDCTEGFNIVKISNNSNRTVGIAVVSGSNSISIGETMLIEATCIMPELHIGEPVKIEISQ